MVRFILFAVLVVLLARVAWRLFGGIAAGLSTRPLGTRAGRPGVRMVRDPICGTFVLPDRAVALTDHGRAVHFCSPTCRDRYQARSV